MSWRDTQRRLRELGYAVAVDGSIHFSASPRVCYVTPSETEGFMPNLIDIAGQRFGRLVAVRKAESRKGHTRWLFRCDCGNEKIANAAHVKSGRTSSCGCLQRELASARFFKHGEKRSRLYSIWSEMKGRCHSSTNRNFPHYGARGISVCQEWQEFSAFRDWALTAGYKPNGSRRVLSLDRIDNDGPYSPHNCRWATASEQANNKGNNRRLRYQGRLLTLQQVSEKAGIPYGTIQSRLKIGLSIEEATRAVDYRKRKIHEPG